jgi:hypothetical protein
MYRTIFGFIALALPTIAAEGQVQIESIKRLDGPIITKSPPVPVGEAPIAVRATPTATTIGLRWGCPANATGYDVYGTPAGGAQQKLTASPISSACLRGDLIPIQQQGSIGIAGQTQPLSHTGFSHHGLLPGQSFTYTVRALYGNGAIGDAVVNATTTPWPAPAGFTATAQGQRATLRWQSVSGAPGYIVFAQAQGEAAFTPVTASPITATTFETQRLQPALEHRFQVQTVNGQTSPTIAVLSGRPFSVKSHDNRFARTVTITWEGTDDALGNTLYRAASSYGPWTSISSAGASPSATDPQSTVGTSYYKLAIRYQSGTVESTPVAGTLRPLPQGVTNLRGTSVAYGTVRLTWTCDPEALHYTIHVSRGGLTGDTIVRDAVGNELRVKSCEQTVNGWTKNAVSYDMTVVAHYEQPFGAWGQLPTLQASVTVANSP